METMVREAWTDERLDDLTNRMDRGFDRVDKDFRDLRGEMNARFGQVDARLDRMDERFNSLQRWMLGSLVTLIVGFMTVFAGLLITRV